MASEMKSTYGAQLPAQPSNNKCLSGKLMWLPPQRSIPRDLLEPVLDNGAYDHPVVVMSNNPSPEGLVEVFLITSFGKRSIDEAFTPKWKHWLQYAPIAPAVHPDIPRLHLVDGCPPLGKPSYVNTRQAHMVHLSALRPHRGGDLAIDSLSLKKLKGMCSFVDLFNPRTPKRLKDYKLWEMDDKWRKREGQAQPPPPGSIITNPYFPAFSWLAQPSQTTNTFGAHCPQPQTYSGCSWRAVSDWRAPHNQHSESFTGVQHIYTPAY
ncbi:hypothetical protein LX36DRAFT_736433 [Colletotrichum falcatum]|nr:hypothetical protein LX36DRAFT_736433 [Colletotrichum falcatum]